MLSRDDQLKSNWGTICTPVEMIAANDKSRSFASGVIQYFKHLTDEKI